MFEPPKAKPPQELKPDGGGHHKLDDFWRHDAYAVTLNGTVEVSGKLEDADGETDKDAKITIEPPYGDAVIATTDGGSSFKVRASAEEEEFDVFVSAGGIAIEGKIQDDQGKAVAGAVLRLLLDGGDLHGAFGNRGSFTVPFLGAGPTSVRDFPSKWSTSKPAFQAEGQFVDEDGKPVAGASKRDACCPMAVESRIGHE